ncbi:hypothetical protein O0I10_012152 [Lichtheimia ornata]|uniref:Uncharacterized protein n=1 Tax=Lichtheimia ornata TaxID=688661 RepID=A0AAD7UT48_9FUNG|nr:uncharacterized protein O0I10_012152 [Lichtheimia ornata]KAJ8652244.1 hypothetical protein O0I10_012152 [Lichtheimia ornata]
MTGEAVKLYIYDLSNGLAKQMSMSLTGRQIDGIWHTSVVVFGQEFYYGQGILTSSPGATHHGQPLEIIDMGETYLPPEVVLEYIESQRSVFTPEKYHLLDFNCNTFSESMCQFLTGKSIPSHITSLPSDFLNTPFGQSMLPMIENMFGQSQAAPSTNAPPPSSAQPSDSAQSLLQNISSAAISAPPKPVQTAQNLASLEQWIQSYKAVVVFFTSATCPPCRMIKPDFERLMEEKNSTGGTKIKILGVIVDTSVAFDAASKYGIRATPTFMLFHQGQKFSDFRGANYAELQSSVNLLLFTAYPPHPHRKIQLRNVVNLPNKPVLYATPGKMDMIFGKLETFLEQDKIELNEQEQRTLSQSKAAIQQNDAKSLDMQHWHQLLDKLLDKLPMDHQFPLLDIFRTLLATQHAADFYMNDCSQLVRVIENGYKQTSIPKASLLMTLRVACNLFAHDHLVTTYFTSTLPTASHRASLTQLLINSLLSPESQVRQTAASLAFNCSTTVANERLKKEQDDEYLSGMPEQEDDDWQIEIVSAVMDVLNKETDEEVVHRLLASIAKFVFLAPEQSSVAELLSALDIKQVIETKKAEKIIKTTSIAALSREVIQLVQPPSP